MDIKTFSNIESTLLSKFNEGFDTFEALKDNVPFNEKTLNTHLEALIAKNIIRFDVKTKKYIYDTPVSGDKVILEGNIMLPTTIIKKGDKLIISRGDWYQFPADFDIRRIIWNVRLPNKSNSSLVDLIKESILKEKRSKIEHLPEYDRLKNILIPWNPNIMLQLNVIGADQTDVSIIFRDKLKMEGSDDNVEFRLFSVRSEIKTEQLIDQLTTPVEQRNYRSIEINKIFNFSDFIFAKNSIPYSNDGYTIEYVTITAIRGKFELTYNSLNNNGITKKLSVETHNDSTEGIHKLRGIFESYAANLLSNSDIFIELND